MQKFIFTILVLFSTFYQMEARRIYADVAATGSNTGATWANAFTTIEAALSSALSGDEIWVKTGNYTPAAVTGFVMKSGVSLYGGFVGTETTVAQRDYINNASILNGGGTKKCVISATNVSASTRLDGFTVTGGNASDPATSAAFLGNSGAGIFISSGSPLIINCNISGNNATYGGSGIQQMGTNANAKIQNCILRDNGYEAVAQEGGGSLKILGCKILYNQGTDGVVYSSAGNLTIDRSVFSANSGGTTIINSGSNSIITNSLIVGNVTSNHIVSLSSVPTNQIFSNSISNNSNAIGRSVLYVAPPNSQPATTTIANNLICNNNNAGTNAVEVLGISFAGLPNYIGNLPGYVNAGTAIDAPFDAGNYDYHLAPTSSFINYGNNQYATVGTDLDGNPRLIGTIDMGPYELQPVSTFGTAESKALFEISPNPAKDYCSINIANLQNANTARVFTITGTLLLSQNISNISNPQIDLTTIENGIYMLEIQSQTGVSSQKMIVVK